MDHGVTGRRIFPHFVKHCHGCGGFAADPFGLITKDRRKRTVCGRCVERRADARRPAQQRAIAAVGAAVMAGILPRAKTLICVDCARPAAVYDHRDYSRLLDVEPVCRSCNAKRGPAQLPSREESAKPESCAFSPLFEMATEGNA